MRMLIIYTKPDCAACASAKNWLLDHAIGYLQVDVSVDAEALAFLQAAGHRTVPQFYSETGLLADGFAGLLALGEAGLRARLGLGAAVTVTE